MPNIWHVGSFHRNMGDFCIAYAQHQALQEAWNETFDMYGSGIKIRFELIDCQRVKFTKEVIDKCNREADMLLIGGGGLVWNREENGSSGWQWDIGIDDIQRIQVPIVVQAIGAWKFEYDPREHDTLTTLSHLGRLAQYAKLFSARDFATITWFKEWGIEAEYCPDPAMFIEPEKYDIGIKPHGETVNIGINLIGDRQNWTYPQDNWLVILRDNIIRAVNMVTKSNGLIHLQTIGHVEDVDQTMFFKHSSYIMSPFFADIYRQMDCVIGMRSHAAVIPFGQNVPFISISSSNKNRAFMKDVGMEDFLIDLRDFDNITPELIAKRIEDLLLRRSEIKLYMATKKAELKKTFDDFNRRVVELL